MYIFPQTNFRPQLSQIQPQMIYSNQVWECINCIIEPSEDRGGLYLGDLLATIRTDTLVQYNIGAVLSVAIDGKYNKTDDPRTQHIITKHILAVDIYGYDISQHFEECYEWIEHHLSKKLNVFVHCRAGKSRSASVVIAYMMKKFNMTFENAYAYVKSKRSRTQPNEGFQILLKQYQQKLSALSSQSLKRSLISNPQNLRLSAHPKQIKQEVKQLKQQSPISPASNHDFKTLEKTQNSDYRKSFQNLGGSIRKSSINSQNQILLTPRKQVVKQRKISFSQNSIDNRLLSDRSSHQQKITTPQPILSQPDLNNRVHNQNTVYQNPNVMMQYPQIYNPQPQPVYHQSPLNKMQTQDIQPKVAPGNVYNYSNNPTDIQRAYQLNTSPTQMYNQSPNLNRQGLNQRPIVQNPKQQSSWLDFFSWFTHQ